MRGFEVDGNHLQLLPDGPERLAALLALVEAAERRLQLIYYIYTDGEAGRLLGRALVDAAARGVEVTLIVDGMGSEVADGRQFFDQLARADIRLCRFTPRWGRRYLLRNHQKLAIADEARAIVGGFNVDDDYFGTSEERAWRDLGLLLHGPAVRHLSGYFDVLSRWTEQPRAPMRALTRALAQWSQPVGSVRWLLGGPTRRLSPWARAVKRDMRQGRLVDIISGYFAPNPAMLRRLDRAGQRGRVRIVLPARTDHQIAVEAARFTYAGLLRKNVQIFEYQPTKLHTKLFLIDDTVYIGSANFDIRSLFLNLEVMVRIADPVFARAVRDYVDGEVEQSERITSEHLRARTSWWTRVKRAAAYFVMATADLKLTRRLNRPDA